MSDPAHPMAPDWVQIQGDWYCVPRHDVDMWPSNMEVIEEVLARGGRLDTTVDVGAHVGFTAIPCARRGATVWAFEANPWAAACLAFGALANGVWPRVRAIHAAVTGRGGEIADVRSVGLVSGMAGLTQAHTQPVVGRAVTVGFEAVLAATGFIDFLKLDIEGGEHELLPSVPRGAWKEVDWFHLETHDVGQEKWHAGAANIDWERLVRDAGFERLTPALWRMARPTVAVISERAGGGDVSVLDRAA